MAKTRSRSTKKTSSKRAKPSKARGPKKARTMVRAGYVELRPIRTKLKADVETLGTAISKSPTPRPELEEALKRMSRFLDDIQDICGSDMMIPVS